LKGEQLFGFYEAQKFRDCQAGLKTIFLGIKNAVVYLLPFAGYSQLHIKYFSASKNITLLII